jgi:hypothetical protein
MMRWVIHVACIGEMTNTQQNILQKKGKGTGHSKGLGVDGKIILKWILKK